MEGDRLARLTSRAVLAALLLAVVAFVASAAAGGAAGPAASTTPLGELAAGLRARRPAALATLGALLLLVAPVARLVGVGLELRARGERRAALMAALALLLLGASLALPHPRAARPSAEGAAPIGSNTR